ncbi:MAG: hypothetical protein ICV66_09615, partial [Chitinophagaceae bacterium]|nr:hypothetical protein [Chitinophagaceae bacterium]
MQTQKASITTMQKIARILLKVVLFALLLFALVFLLLLTPPVQRFATTRVEVYLNKKLKTKVEIGRISIGLPEKILLKDVYVEDQTRDTLISGGTIKANISLFKLMNNQVEVNDIQLTDITAKIKRILPDTVFNFQFIVDAFVTEKTKQPDTAQTAPLKLDVYNLKLNNFNVVYKDVITGNDMYAHIGRLNAKIDTLNPYTSNFDVNSLAVRNAVIRFNQVTPLVQPEPVSKDVAEAAQPSTMKLNFGNVNLDSVSFDYGNDVSSFYTKFNVGHLAVEGRQIDLQNRILHLNNFEIERTLAAIKLGKKQQAKMIEKEVAQEVQAQAQNDWTIRVDNFKLNSNTISFDDDNKPVLNYGMDYAHLHADSLTLHVDDFVLKTDSIGGVITKGSFKEKNGFQLDALQANVLYAYNQSYLKDLYIKTPGTELKRNAELRYNSFKALTDSFAKTQMDVDISNSYIQVKDILAFAPQLKHQPAFSNPNDVWHVNLQGNGSMERLHIAALQFDGLRDTRIDAEGTLANLTNPNTAGGTFVIRRLHT